MRSCYISFEVTTKTLLDEVPKEVDVLVEELADPQSQDPSAAAQLAELKSYFDASDANFAFPINLLNIVHTDDTGLVGDLNNEVKANLRVEIPHVKVDISEPSLRTLDNCEGNCTEATWLVTVLNASNWDSTAKVFCGEGDWSGPVCSDTLGTSLTKIENAKLSAQIPATGIARSEDAVRHAFWEPLGSYNWNVQLGEQNECAYDDEYESTSKQWYECPLALPALAPGQVVQVLLKARFTDEEVLEFFTPVENRDKSQLILNGGPQLHGLLHAEVAVLIDEVPFKEGLTRYQNEAASDSSLNDQWELWRDWVALQIAQVDPECQESCGMFAAMEPWDAGVIISRLAATLIDSDRWDQVNTMLAPAALELDWDESQTPTVVLGPGPVGYQVTITNIGFSLLTNGLVYQSEALTSDGQRPKNEIQNCVLAEGSAPPGSTAASGSQSQGEGGGEESQDYRLLIENLAPGQSVVCTGTYMVEADDIINRWQSKPDDALEGIWTDRVAEGAPSTPTLHINLGAWATPEYLNPAWVLDADANYAAGLCPVDWEAPEDWDTAQGSCTWLYRDAHLVEEHGAPAGVLMVRNTLNFQVPIFGMIELPNAGEPKPVPWATIGLVALTIPAGWLAINVSRLVKRRLAD